VPGAAPGRREQPAHKPLILRATLAEVPLTGLSLMGKKTATNAIAVGGESRRGRLEDEKPLSGPLFAYLYK
jgi:hypothetical protein